MARALASSLVWVLLMILFTFGACGKKNPSSSPENSGGSKDEVASATAEADIAGATAGAGAAKANPLDKKEQVFRVPVYAEPLVRGEMKSYLSGVGTLSPEERLLVKAEISGTLSFSGSWKEGGAVRKGQVIATIDNEEVRFARNEAEKALQLAEERVPPALERLKLERRTLASKERLYKEGVISRLEYDRADVSRMEAELSYNQTLAEVERRKTELEKVKYRQDRSVITAPFDGVLVRKEYLEPGQAGSASYPVMSLNERTVSAGQSLFGIIKTSRFRLEMDVSSKEIDRVQPGQPAEVHVYSGEVIDVTGVVEGISTALDPLTRSFKVTVLVPDPGGRLSSGMFCKVDIVVEKRIDAIAIPREIVQTRGNRTVVFVVEQQEARQREVELGIVNRERVEILEGLHEGDLLVIRGYETLKDHTKVKLAESDEDSTESPDQDLSGRPSSS